MSIAAFLVARYNQDPSRKPVDHPLIPRYLNFVIALSALTIVFSEVFKPKSREEVGTVQVV